MEFLLRTAIRCYTTDTPSKIVRQITLYHRLRALPSLTLDDLAYLFLDASGKDSPQGQDTYFSSWSLGVSVTLEGPQRHLPVVSHVWEELRITPYSMRYPWILASGLKLQVEAGLEQQQWLLAKALRDGTGPFGGPLEQEPVFTLELGRVLIRTLDWVRDSRLRR